MKRKLNWLNLPKAFAYMVLAAGVLQPMQALPASIDLATAPLANATTTAVLPNLMFILDSSGSMDWNFLPDWVDDSICKNTNGSYNLDCVNSPLFKSPDVNGVYYNPDIYYKPPVNAAGTPFGSQTTWTNVKNDAYSIQDRSGTTNLTTNYVDVEWCTDSSYNDCLRNDNYILPTVGILINGKSYNTPHTTTSTGTGSVVSGAPDNPSTTTRTFGPHYYRINPGEWCDTAKLVNCQPTQDSAHSFPARVRWCTNATYASAQTPPANTCQGLRAGSYKTIRFPTRYYVPGQAAVTAVAASATIRFTNNGCTSNSRKVGVKQIIINGTNILRSETNEYRYADDLVDAIRSKGANSGYSFAGSGDRLIITAPVSAGNVTNIISFTRTADSEPRCSFSLSPTTPQLGGYIAAAPAVAAGFTGSFTRTDIVSGSAYPRSAGRTDCVASTNSCTYAEEMTNFANWWTYYQTRMQTMKTATSLAFKPIDNRYRVGFIDIYGTNYLPAANFTAGTGNTKDLWYQKLFSMNPNGGTPLRSALARVGQIYAGQKPVGSADPVQYSCQQNFALLTTDGYWNGDTNYRGNTTGVNGLGGDLVGDNDGGTTPRPMYEGPTVSENSLADVAKYYFDTDLRTSALSNCIGAEGVDVCTNNVFMSGTDNNVKQHMTTFTLGLGVDGSLTYTSDYKTASSGDYYNIINGTGSSAVNWPVPVADTETAVDDLWHAAVNGQGTYFSAKDPGQLASGLNGALSAIGSKLGAGSAAATSSLNPVPGDNFAYVASYTTTKWQGNLEARTINLTTGDVSKAPSWCVEDTIDANCSSPSSITSSTAGGSTTYYCSTPNSTADLCVGGTLDGAICNVEVTKACTGTMRAKVGGTTDTRNIKMVGSAGSLVDFNYDNLSTTQKTYFTGTGLSQWALLSDDQKTVAAGANLVAFLRGQTGYEDRINNDVIARLYRYREATLGDITESQPEFLGKPVFKYTDAGYAAFLTAQATRAKTVYVGANDGMLHAFNAEDGTERWAFVPTLVIPKMWKLADKNYATLHTNYVNGRPIIADVYDTSVAPAKWRTILVAGLSGGGRGYYALDITDPTTPSLLWQIDSTNEANLGYSYGYPAITKKSDGTWVVLFTSGYNNTSPGNGKGYLYVRNAISGASIARIATGEGDGTTPSGLAKISIYADDPMRNNTAIVTYGGDLLGNLWRFDINTATAMKLATLKDDSGTAQPITTAPELGVAYGKRIVFVGTGKYLETSDLEDTQQQTLYAIKDDGVTSTITDPRAVMVQQTLTTDGAIRTASKNMVNLRAGRGWYIDFSDSGERINVDPTLDSGLLIAPTTVPSNTVCQPGGYGWLNYFNYLTGTNEDGIVSQKYDAPIVGINVYYTPDGVRHTSVVTANNPTPEQPAEQLPGTGRQLIFQGKRVIWRELIP